MHNYQLTIQYDGTRYKGWQIQGNTQQTIQGRLEAVISRLAGESVEVHGSGRTDAGVHALGQVANVKLSQPVDSVAFLHQINHFLPEDIAVVALAPASERFHARLNATAKTYRYRIWNSAIPNVLERHYLTSFPAPLDCSAMRQAAGYLIGTHDFRSFCGLKRFKKSTIRTLFSIELEQIGPEITFLFCGNGFLMRMVRILTGTLLEVGTGQRNPEDMPTLLAVRDRTAAGPAMPPQGLTLLQVDYE